MWRFPLFFLGIPFWRDGYSDYNPRNLDSICYHKLSQARNHFGGLPGTMIPNTPHWNCCFLPSNSLDEDVSWQVRHWDNRYRLDLRFVGTCYSGFQTWNKKDQERTIHAKVVAGFLRPNNPRPSHFRFPLRRFDNVQVEDMLRVELRAYTRSAAQINLTSAARTDAGVHALELPSHFDLPLEDEALALRIAVEGSEDLLLRWNRRLPPVLSSPN